MKSIKIIALGTVSALVGHLVVEIIKSGRERVIRAAAGESTYEKTHPKRK